MKWCIFIFCFLVTLGLAVSAPLNVFSGPIGHQGPRGLNQVQKTVKTMRQQIIRMDKTFTIAMDSLKTQLGAEKEQRLKLESRLVGLELSIVGAQNDQPIGQVNINSGIILDDDGTNGTDEPSVVLGAFKSEMGIGKATDSHACDVKRDIKNIFTELEGINRKLGRRGTAWASLGLPKLM